MSASLPYDFDDQSPYLPNVARNHAALESLMSRLGLDALVVTSQDEYVTEYTPTRNNPRYALSAFSGSVGDGIFVRRQVADALGLRGQFVLFVDGRYHLQADRQTSPDLVVVDKVPLGGSIWAAIAAWLADHSAEIAHLAYDSRRLSAAQKRGLEADLDGTAFTWHGLSDGEVDSAIELPGWNVDRPIFTIPDDVVGRSVDDNLRELSSRIRQRFGDEPTCFMTCASDDVCYLLNTRGYHLPHSSSHLGHLFVIGDEVALYLPHGCDTCPVDIPSPASLRVIRGDIAQVDAWLRGHAVRHVCYSAAATSCALEELARRVWPDASHDHDFKAVEAMRVAKTPAELDAVRLAFANSSRAIAETMRWVKYGEAGARHSEFDITQKIAAAYAAQGAVGLSFTSLAATGDAAAVIHYSMASRERYMADGDMVMLDSGAYYDAGFATDCTRVVLRSTSGTAEPAAWQREIYTVALKACIAGLVAKYPTTATGGDVDSLVRAVCRAHDHDYAHGTGHGIGIHVHEGGVSFSPTSTLPIVPNAVVSVEPGIYLSGKGGVRIENIVIVHPDPDDDTLVQFENVVHVGYDWDLIDLDLLSDAERDYLRAYERRCQELGTSVTPCPLLADAA